MASPMVSPSLSTNISLPPSMSGHRAPMLSTHPFWPWSVKLLCMCANCGDSRNVFCRGCPICKFKCEVPTLRYKIGFALCEDRQEPGFSLTPYSTAPLHSAPPPSYKDVPHLPLFPPCSTDIRQSQHSIPSFRTTPLLHPTPPLPLRYLSLLLRLIRKHFFLRSFQSNPLQKLSDI